MRGQTDFERGENKGYRDALLLNNKCTNFDNKSESYQLGYEKGFKEGVLKNEHAEKTGVKNFATGYKEGRYLSGYRTQSDIKR